MARLDPNGLSKLWEFVQRRTPIVAQTTGGSEKAVMSQKAVTEAVGLPPDYVVAESASVVDKVLAKRNAHSIVFAAISDCHTTGADVSANGILHAGQAMSLMQGGMELDFVANLGDVAVDKLDASGANGFKYVKKCLADIRKSVPYIQLQGNHDELPADTTAEAQQKYYAYIGANNVDTITDYQNQSRNFGYRDFEKYKVRVIYVNTADVSESDMTYDNHITAAQMDWIANTALNLSAKDDASEWGIIVMGHHPLNWEASGNGSVPKLLTVLDDYKGRTSGGVKIDGEGVDYDFTGEKAELICHIHGHLHNFREEVLGNNKVLSITVPNACFGRNNEYGNYDYSIYPDVVENYGDDGGNNDGSGTQRTYTKTSETADDTAFSVFCIDRDSKTINIYNYGAGVDRVWDYANGVKGEGSGDAGGDVTPSYTNEIPLSVNADGSEYVGHNGEDGYSAGYRVNSSGAEVAQSGMCCTGFIQVNYNVVRLKNVTIAGTKDAYLVQYRDDKSYWQVRALADVLQDDGAGVYTGTLSFAGWMRISCGVIDDTSILTLDEEIV